MRRLLLLAPLALVLAACGGGKSTSDSGNPLVDAADATAKATSEKTSMTGKVLLPGQTLTLRGDGGYDHTTDEGWQHITVATPGASPATIDEIFVKGVLWMKSALFANAPLPKGKEWVKVDINKAGMNLGFNFKALMGQTPADVLKQMQRTATPVTTVGTEQIGGVETTHYRAAIDTNKIPAADTFQKLTTAKYKPIDVWVDEDGRVRQARFDYTSKIEPSMAPRARVVLTMKLTDFGTTADVEPPKASLVVDISDPVGSG